MWKSRWPLFLLGGVVVAFALFCLSVALFGSWWRFPNMPTAEEWSAFFGASALLALFFAWYQVRQVDQSNRALIASNDQARLVNIEQIRPRVRAYFDVDRSATKRRGDPSRGSIYVAVENFGPNAATNVRLSVDEPFQSLDVFFKPGRMESHLNGLKEIFNGSVYFDTLLPGRKYVWFLGSVPELMDDTTLKVRSYNVTVHYDGVAGGPPYEEAFRLDLDLERNLERPVKPLDRIGKDLEVIGDKIDAVVAKLPKK